MTEAKTHLELACQQEDNSSDGRANYRTQQIANLQSTLTEQEASLKETENTVAKLTDPEFQKTLNEQRELQMSEQTQANRLAQLQSTIAQTQQLPVSTVMITVLDGKAN